MSVSSGAAAGDLPFNQYSYAQAMQTVYDAPLNQRTALKRPAETTVIVGPPPVTSPGPGSATTPSAQPARVEGSPDVTFHPVNDDPCRDGTILVRTQCVWWLFSSGGAYKDVLKFGGENHHMPADSASPLSTGRGPAINMIIADHMRTASWGGRASSKKYRRVQAMLIHHGLFREAQQMDIDNVRALFGDKYDSAIQQMLEYTDTLGV